MCLLVRQRVLSPRFVNYHSHPQAAREGQQFPKLCKVAEPLSWLTVESSAVRGALHIYHIPYTIYTHCLRTQCLLLFSQIAHARAVSLCPLSFIGCLACATLSSARDSHICFASLAAAAKLLLPAHDEQHLLLVSSMVGSWKQMICHILAYCSRVMIRMFAPGMLALGSRIEMHGSYGE